MRIYICGPITGLPYDNKPAFEEAERIITDAGCDAINPHKICEEIVANHQGTNEELWVKCMRADIPQVITSDAVLRLPGWENSRGAMLELQIATKLNIPVYTLDQFKQTYESVDDSRG